MATREHVAGDAYIVRNELAPVDVIAARNTARMFSEEADGNILDEERLFAWLIQFRMDYKNGVQRQGMQ